MSVRQIAIEYNPLEDRMLMRIATTDDQEFQIWLTRRYVTILWKALLDIMMAQPRIALQADEQVRNELLSLDHIKTVSQCDFGKPFKGVSDNVAEGENGVSSAKHAPILVSNLEVSKRDGEPGTHPGYEIGLMPAVGQGIRIGLDQDFPHALAKMLQDAAARAEWGLDLVFPAQRQEEVSGVTMPTIDGSVVIH